MYSVVDTLPFVVGRVKRGVSLGQAQADMDSRDE